MTELLDDLTGKVEAMKQEIKGLQERVAAESKQILSDGVKVLFEAYPFVGAVRWTQYTPFFNDGEPCTFRCNADYPGIATVSDLGRYKEEGHDDDFNWGEDGHDFYSLKYGDDQKASALAKEASTAWTKFLSAIPEEVYLSLFGDHVSVTITRDAVEVEEYEHD